MGDIQTTRIPPMIDRGGVKRRSGISCDVLVANETQKPSFKTSQRAEGSSVVERLPVQSAGSLQHWKKKKKSYYVNSDGLLKCNKKNIVF